MTHLSQVYSYLAHTLQTFRCEQVATGVRGGGGCDPTTGVTPPPPWDHPHAMSDECGGEGLGKNVKVKFLTIF